MNETWRLAETSDTLRGTKPSVILVDNCALIDTYREREREDSAALLRRFDVLEFHPQRRREKAESLLGLLADFQINENGKIDVETPRKSRD